eukprot:gene24662-10288_t
MIASTRTVQSSIRCSGSARSSVVAFARGPVVTKKGTAFKTKPTKAMESESGSDEEVGTVGLAVAAAGLPPGPGGALGAAEGIGYLVVLGIVAWSLKVKTDTGSGLPAGPAGLLGAAEGLSYLSFLGGRWLLGGLGKALGCV